MAFLPFKNRQTYLQLFRTIRDGLIEEFGDIGIPKVCHFDHEEAALGALLEVFPEWETHSCYFHYQKVRESFRFTLQHINFLEFTITSWASSTGNRKF